MGSGKHEKRSKTSPKNPKRRLALASSRGKLKKKIKDKRNEGDNSYGNEIDNNDSATASQQLSFFLDLYQSHSGIRLSSLELEPIKETCIVELPQGLAHDVGNLAEHMKVAFGLSWKEVLCGKQLMEGKIDPGSPALLTISLSALRSLELIKGLRPLTKECHAAKLFAKHMKIEDQVSHLKNRVNIASGTPSRIKKLIDIEALGLSRLAVILLDLHTDVKGYSLFTLPQVRDEFWDLYKSYFHDLLVQGVVRICLYGQMPTISKEKKKKNP